DRGRAARAGAADGRDRHGAGDVYAACAAAAANRLDQDAGGTAAAEALLAHHQVGIIVFSLRTLQQRQVEHRNSRVGLEPGRDDVPVHRGSDVSASSAVAAEAAESEADAARIALGRGNPAADVDSAHAAA